MDSGLPVAKRTRRCQAQQRAQQCQRLYEKLKEQQGLEGCDSPSGASRPGEELGSHSSLELYYPMQLLIVDDSDSEGDCGDGTREKKSTTSAIVSQPVSVAKESDNVDETSTTVSQSLSVGKDNAGEDVQAYCSGRRTNLAGDDNRDDVYGRSDKSNGSAVCNAPAEGSRSQKQKKSNTKRKSSALKFGLDNVKDLLPRGWRVKETVRTAGRNAGSIDRYYYSPSGSRFSSLKKVLHFLEAGTKPKSSGSADRGKDDNGMTSPRSPNRSAWSALKFANAMDWLPRGWTMKQKVRTNGASAGHIDTYYYAPSGHQFRSLDEVLHFLEAEDSSPRNDNVDVDETSRKRKIMDEDEDLEAKKKMVDEIQMKLKEMEEQYTNVEDCYRTLFVQERRNNDELQEARKELISALWDANSRAHIGVKLMGALDPEPFKEATKDKYSHEEADVKALEFRSLWEEHLRDPSWHPFKILTDEQGKAKEIIDENDEKLKDVKNELGDKVYEAVITTLKEINEYNPSGRYPIPELWNYKEGRKASMGEGVVAVKNKLKRKKR